MWNYTSQRELWAQNDLVKEEKNVETHTHTYRDQQDHQKQLNQANKQHSRSKNQMAVYGR